MTKTISATEAKNRFGKLLKELEASEEDIIIESRGVPTAVVVTIERFREFQAAFERAQRLQAFEEYKKLRAEIEQQNADMSTEDAQEFAKQLSDEVMENVVAKHQIKIAS